MVFDHNTHADRWWQGCRRDSRHGRGNGNRNRRKNNVWKSSKSMRVGEICGDGQSASLWNAFLTLKDTSCQSNWRHETFVSPELSPEWLPRDHRAGEPKSPKCNGTSGFFVPCEMMNERATLGSCSAMKLHGWQRKKTTTTNKLAHLESTGSFETTHRGVRIFRPVRRHAEHLHALLRNWDPGLPSTQWL